MTEASYPFPPATAGDLTDPGVIATADKWRRMGRHFVRSGVHFGDGDNLEVTADPSGLAVFLKTGSATVEGFHYENDAQARFTPPAAGSVARQDRLVARLSLDPTTGSGRVRALVRAGTPGLVDLVHTDTTYDVPLGDWTVGAGAGLVSAVRSLGDLSRYARGEQPPLFSGAPPSVAAAQTAAQRRDGETWWDNSSGRWLEYVLCQGQWCIRPGQVLVDNLFWDGGGKHYTGPWWRIGEARDGAPVGRESTVTWTMPRSLPGHGFEVSLSVSPYTSGSPHGDLALCTLFAYAPNSGPIGYPILMPTHGLYAANYTSTINRTQYFDAADPAMGGATGGTRTWCVAGNLGGNGYLQFWQGQLVVRAV